MELPMAQIEERANQYGMVMASTFLSFLIQNFCFVSIILRLLTYCTLNNKFISVTSWDNFIHGGFFDYSRMADRARRVLK